MLRKRLPGNLSMSHLLKDSFVLDGIREEPMVRLDGRRRFDMRALSLKLGPLPGQSEVRIGETIARCSVSGEVVAPLPERPNEGRLMFNVEFGPIASPSFEPGRPNIEAMTLCNQVERVLRGSKAIDVEALCVLGGRKVWSVRADIHAMNDDGNLTDACCLAALSALLSFRKEEVDERGAVIPSSEREPVPLSVHHLPLTTTFSLFPAKSNGITIAIADPSAAEERAGSGLLTLTVNQHGEFCGVHKPGGAPIDMQIIKDCTQLAIKRAVELTALIQKHLEETKNTRQLKRRDIHHKYAKDAIIALTLDQQMDVSLP